MLALCLCATACKSATKDDEMAERGFVISVTYDANGGKFLNREGITIKDYFNPNEYDKGTDGSVQIKLIEPTDPSRPTSGLDPITLGRAEYFCAGWYEGRELVRDAEGNPVDHYGVALKEKEDGTFVYLDNEKKTADAAYTYSDRWDFGSDVISYKADDYADKGGRMSLTLYAAWVPFYEFNYYYEIDGEWTLSGTTSFDYQKATATDSDIDTIYTPKWDDGAMVYKTKYKDGSEYSFPKLADATFEKAYLDSEKTNPITESFFVHEGSLDLETGTAVNRVQNIYVETTEGEQYRITEARQIVENPNVKGYYEIQADLDFTDLKWPMGLSIGVFSGKFYGKDGQNYKISNVNAQINSDAAIYGGLFGNVAKGAEIKNVTFENVTLDLATANGKSNETAFGLFAGLIDDGAIVENVTVGGTFRIGSIWLSNGYQFNLIANGDRSGVTGTGVELWAYGKDMKTYYTFTFDVSKISVDEETGDVLGFAFKNIRDRERKQLEFKIN